MVNNQTEEKMTGAEPLQREVKLSVSSWLNPVGFIVLVVSLVTTFFFWRYTQNNVSHRARLKFDSEVSESKFLIQQRLELYLDALHGFQALFAASERLEGNAWAAYARKMNLKKRYPGISALRFIERVGGQEKSSFVHRLRNDPALLSPSYLNFNIYPEGERDEYFVVKYVEPFSENEKMIGFDVGKEPFRKAALVRARDSGKPIATEPIRSVVKGQSASFSIAIPIYRNDRSQSSSGERQTALVGFVDAMFKADDLLSNIFAQKTIHPHVGFEVFDGEILTREHLLYDDDDELHASDPHYRTRFSVTIPLEVAGHVWSLHFSALPEFGLGALLEFFPLFVLLGGLVLSFLSFGIFYALSISRGRAVKLAQMMTRDHQWEIAERKRIEDDLRKAYGQTELLLASITSILIGVSHDGLITHWNAVAENTFGIPTGQILNKPFTQSGIKWDSARVFSGIAECRQRGRPLRLDDVSFLRANGREGFLGITIIPVKQSAEGKIECVLFGADVTERKRVEQLKDEFVSTVSHELRTPLTVMKEGVSQVVEGILGPVNEDQKRFLNISLEGMERLGRIVDDLLDISKIKAGKFELKKELVDIVQLTQEVCDGFKRQAEERGLKLKTNFPEKHPGVYVDRDKLIQVFTNLLSNAFKFTVKGDIEIEIHENGNRVECSVSDTGKGISQEDLPKVFGKFQQFGRIAGPGDKGTGLGLAICKGIVELHRGQILVESKLGEGTRFIFTLPRYSARELFKDHITKGLSEAVKQESSLSIIVFDVENYDSFREKVGEKRAVAIVHRLENVIKQNLRRQADVAVKDTSAILVLLPAATKEETLMVAGRIQQAFDDCLTREHLKGEMRIACKVAVFPDDGNNEEELLAKVEGVVKNA